MTHDDAFMQAIIQNPDDDTPRLVYADWLDEHGDPRRAEFIRLQCHLAAAGEGDSGRPDLLDREWELLTVYRPRWQPVAPSVLAKHLFESAFVRGFFARIHVPAADLLEHGEEWFRTFPLEELRITDVGSQLDEIARRSWLAQVSSLELSHNILPPEDFRALLSSPYLRRLRRLTLRNVGLDAEGMERLANWPGLARVTHLNLGNDYFGPERQLLENRLGPAGLRPLIESPNLERLTSLRLHNPLTEADVAFLASAPRLASLTHLRMYSCGLTVNDARVLGRAQGLPALRHLAVGANPFGDEGNAVLVASPLLARLDTLDLNTMQFGPQAAATLAASPHLGRLRSLDLTQCRIGPQEAKALATARFGPGTLTELRLFNDKIGPEGMAALARSPFLAGLTRLDLMDNDIGPEGAQALAGSPVLVNLRSLELARNKLQVEGAKALAGSPVLSRLRHLSLWLNHLGARGARAVMQSPFLSKLWSLDLSYNTFTDKTARLVASSTPLGELRRFILDAKGLTKEGERMLAASPRLPHLLQIQRGRPFGELAWPVSPVLLEQGKGREL